MTDPNHRVATYCLNNGGMTPWERLGQHVVARRVQLGYRTRGPFAEALGVSLRTLGDLETGRRDRFEATTLASLENVLGWTTGSVNRILSGDTPQLLQDSPEPASTDKRDAASEALVKVMTSDQLSDSDKAKIVRLLIAEREAFNRRIAEQADEMIQAFQSGS